MDNQFVPRELFAEIAGRIKLKDILEGVLQGRKEGLIERYRQVIETEYKRSLLYSSQVVLNRNAFWNAPLLIASALGDDHKGLVTLLAKSVIVPFLLTENSFEQEPTFDVLPQGRAAVESLAKDPDLAELVCVRFGGDDEQENKRKKEDLTINFLQQLTYFRWADDPQERAREISRIILSGGVGDLQREEAITALANRLEELAKWIIEERPTRNTIYKNSITIGNPADGFYRTDPLTFELKVWVDLVYNTNLPRHLGVLTFIPPGFPTPLDVGLIWPIDPRRAIHLEQAADDVLRDIEERVRNHALWNAWDVVQRQADLSIPSPHELTHADIVEIRDWEEWKIMMKGLETYLKEPLEEKSLQAFHESYDEFHKRMSSWWLRRNVNARKEWVSGIAKVYRWGEWFFGLLQVAKEMFPILPPKGIIPRLPPKEIIEVAVEGGLYLFQRTQVDWRRTQLVRSMQTTQRIHREDLLRTWERIKRLYPELPNTYPGHDLSGRLATEEG
jgi:hypothetical protein